MLCFDDYDCCDSCSRVLLTQHWSKLDLDFGFYF